jgi:hypothetical protein
MDPTPVEQIFLASYQQLVAKRGGPASWATNPTVAEINSYAGSAEFWQPVKDQMNAYTRLRADQIAERMAILTKLDAAIMAWRANQAKNWWNSGLDDLKSAALIALSDLMGLEIVELEDLGTPARLAEPTVRPTVSMPIGVGTSTGKPSAGGSSSLIDGLDNTPDNSKIGLSRNVQPEDRGGDQRRYLVDIGGDGILKTHDGRFLIDTHGKRLRYVMVVVTGKAVLYAHQSVSAEDEATLQAHDSMVGYPALDSHAQIDGHVIGAGDFIVSQGRIQWISNKSGTWQPGGANLAATLKLLVRMKVLNENAIVKKRVTVAQFIHRPEGYDVDDGDLMELYGRIMDGKLWK